MSRRTPMITVLALPDGSTPPLGEDALAKEWLDWAGAVAQGLPPRAAFRVALSVCCACGKGGTADVSLRTIATDLRRSERTIQTWLMRLVSLGWLTCARKGGDAVVLTKSCPAGAEHLIEEVRERYREAEQAAVGVLQPEGRA